MRIPSKKICEEEKINLGAKIALQLRHPHSVTDQKHKSLARMWR